MLSWAKQYPVVTVVGPRQSGKSTLVQALFPEKAYISFEDLDKRMLAREDPRGMINTYRNGAIFDEIQNVPELVSYLQTEVDSDKTDGSFILTGSQQFELMLNVSQSLAGRTAIARLLPLSIEELSDEGKAEKTEADEYLYKGFYPRIYDKGLQPTESYSFYVSTYLERDIHQLINVENISQFEKFLKLCAAHTGQLLNLNRMGNDIGVSHNTIKKWISVLEASFIVKLIPSWNSNIRKRVVKAPKLYFLDPGLVCYLLRITELYQIQAHPLRGALFETLVVSEALKSRFNGGKNDNLYFYRNQQGHEIDLLMEYADGLDLYEIKSSQTINKSFFKNLDYFNKNVQAPRSKNLIYGGDKKIPFDDHNIIPWSNAFGTTIQK